MQPPTKTLSRLALAAMFTLMLSAPALAAGKTFMPVLPPKQEKPAKKKDEKTFMPVLPKKQQDVRIMPVEPVAR